MNLSAAITDNVTEILVKIIEFTHNRQKLLTQNIQNINKPGFVPKDLPEHQFSRLLNAAIDEHINSGKLLLRDTELVKFGANGTFEIAPVPDTKAGSLLTKSKSAYIKLQITKLVQNLLDRKAAFGLLRQKGAAEKSWSDN
ncbi:MAG TPA: hypothetical protein VMW23_03475 [Sedimentisphaerales bacterium]|nr:hypothetical protein [Sedimentisphaerales bacterium]